MPRKRVNVRVTITLPAPELKRVDNVSKRMTIPRSAVIRIAVLEYLKRTEGQSGS
jgi:metal-responsive CopG/Arc/MetJ family transcriptional regulator